MLQKKVIFIFTLVGIIFSCTKEVRIDLPKAEQKMVVNCLFTKDSTFLVNLTELNDAFDNQIYAINNAAISLYENDIFVEHLTPADPNGNYISSILPKEGKKYAIVCEHKDFPTATAIDYLPYNPSLITISSIKDSVAFEPDWDKPYSQISVDFIDDVHKNYYEVKVFNLYQPEQSVSYYSEASYIFSHDLSVENNDAHFFQGNSILFSDELFNGKKKTITINFYQIFSEELGVVVLFREVSENYYNYKKGLYNHVYSQYGGFGIGAGNPIDMYNNIENGYGVFAGYTQVVDTIFR
ncbi:MAG: DUF4249 domain-containing protein [Bacteroidia bacterium]